MEVCFFLWVDESSLIITRSHIALPLQSFDYSLFPGGSTIHLFVYETPLRACVCAFVHTKCKCVHGRARNEGGTRRRLCVHVRGEERVIGLGDESVVCVGLLYVILMRAIYYMSRQSGGPDD
eukprot:GHVU01209035.1.p1 GENE.GHVU01209035.1~~GHVU01209035.1.p1  ORF type:complete len:122 (+),score=3.90 GHVU01209035.1:135-500(+)